MLSVSDLEVFPEKFPDGQAIKSYCVKKLRQAYEIFTAATDKSFTISLAGGVEQVLTGLGYQDPAPHSYTTLKDRVEVLAKWVESRRLSGGAFQSTGGLSSSDDTSTISTLEEMMPSIDQYLEVSSKVPLFVNYTVSNPVDCCACVALLSEME